MRRRDVAALRRSLTGRSRIGEAVRYVLIPVIGAAAGLIGVLALVASIAEELESTRPDRRSEAVAMGLVLVLMVAAAVLLIGYAIRTRQQRLRPRQHLRLSRFAAANGLDYAAGPAPSVLLGRLRDRGRFDVRSVVSSRGRPRVEVGEFELTIMREGTRESRLGGYCALQLPRRLPNLVLLASGQRSHPMRELPPSADQRLRLEGDFDRSFALFCPAGYERDALYLMTPDVMARLVDAAQGWDVEVVEDVLVLSRAHRAIRLDPDAWRHLAGVVDALDDKVARWVRWRDSHVRELPAVDGTPLADEVAAPGRRLRSSSVRAMAAILLLAGSGVAIAFLGRLLD